VGGVRFKLLRQGVLKLRVGWIAGSGRTADCQVAA